MPLQGTDGFEETDPNNSRSLEDNGLEAINMNEDFGTSDHESYESMDEDMPEPRITEEEMHTNIARFIYRTASDFTAEESTFVSSLFDWIVEFGAPTNYSAPTTENLSNGLLDAEYDRVKEQFQKKISEAKSVAVTLHRINQQFHYHNKRAFVTFILTTPDPAFFSSVDFMYFDLQTEEEEREENYNECVTEQCVEIFNKVPKEKIVCFISEVKCFTWPLGKLDFYEGIPFVYCLTDMLDNIYKDTCALEMFKSVIKTCRNVVKCIKSNDTVKERFQQIQTMLYGDDKKNLLTRRRVVCLDRFYKNKQALIEIASLNDLNIQSEIRDTLLSTENWNKIEFCLKILTPIKEAIALSQQSALLSDAPRLFNKIKQSVIETQPIQSDNSDLLNIVDKARMLNGIHYASNLLDPRYVGESLQLDEVTSATEFITKLARDDAHRVLDDLMHYKNKTGQWNNPSAWNSINETSPHTWWEQFESPLSDISIKLLFVRASLPYMTTSECFYSAISNIHNNGFENLSDEQLRKVKFVSGNLNTGNYKSFDESDGESMYADSE